MKFLNLNTSITSLIMLFSFHGIANAYKLNQDGILMSNDGKVALLNYYAAMTSCPHGTHPSTVRELAEDAKSHGAVGIIDALSCANAIPAGFSCITGHNIIIDNAPLPQGSDNDYYFYYNSSGYNSNGELNNKFFTSSWGESIFPQFKYAFNGSTGEIFYGNWTGSGDEFAVRCFQNQ